MALIIIIGLRKSVRKMGSFLLVSIRKYSIINSHRNPEGSVAHVTVIKQLQDGVSRTPILHATGMLESYAVCRRLIRCRLDGEHSSFFSWMFVETHISLNLP